MGAGQSKAAAASSNINVLNSTDIGISDETYNSSKNTCESTTNQKNVLNIIGSNVTKLKTSQKNAAKNTCILQTAIQDTKKNKAAEYAQMMESLKSKLAQGGSAAIGIAPDTNVNQTNLFSFKANNRTVNEQISGCVMKVDQENVINIVGSNVTDSELSQENDSVMECLSAVGAVEKTPNPFAGQPKEKDSSSKSSSDNDDEKSASESNPIVVVLLICLVSLCCILSILSIMMFMSGKPSKKSKSKRSAEIDADAE
jgi:hypothetical protein